MFGPEEVALLRDSFVGVCVAMLEEVSLWGRALKSHMLKLHPINSLLLPVDQDIKLSALFPAPCLPAYYHASCHDIMDQISKTGSHPQLNVFLYRSCCGHGISLPYKNPKISSQSTYGCSQPLDISSSRESSLSSDLKRY